MARQITVTFAFDGDKVSIPVETQANGEVSFNTGYTFDYQRPKGSSPLAKDVERVKMNALFNDITGILQQFQQQGAPEWYPDTPYSQFARVKHGGSYYVALIDDTEEEPGTGGDWVTNNVSAAARQNNLSATTDPTATDDNTEGYEPLSQWINTVSGEIFVAISVATGAANWQQGTVTIDELGNVALLNANAVGQNLIQAANPSAISFLRVNADNSISWRSASQLRSDLSLGTAALVNTTTSATDVTIGSVPVIRAEGIYGIGNTGGSQNLPTSGAGSADSQSIPTGMYIALNTSFASPPFGANDVYLVVHRGGGSQSSQTAHIFGVTPRKATRNYVSGSWSAWGEEWNSSNLVKTTSQSDSTAGSVLLTGSGGLLGNSIVSNDWNAITVSAFYHNTSDVAVGIPTNATAISMIHMNQSSTTAMQMAFRSGSNQFWVRRKSSSTWQAWVEGWHSGNLVKTTSATDTTAGRMLQVGDGGLNGPGMISADLDTIAVNGFWRGMTTTPLGTFPHFVQFGGGDGQNVTQFGGISGIATDLKFRKRIGGTWQTIYSLWHTGNTSANVQTMLAAADNSAIRAAISVPVNSSGTFTPVVRAGGSPAGGTFTTQTGRYERIGNRVFMQINLVWNSLTGTGSIDISGLPFTSSATNRTVWNVRGIQFKCPGDAGGVDAWQNPTQMFGETLGSSSVVDLGAYNPVTGNTASFDAADNVNINRLTLNGVMEI